MIPRATVSVKGSRSQSALEYMMTYGWAILIIVIVAAVLYSLGIFSPSSSAGTTVTGFSGLGSPTALCMANGGLRLQLGDNLGTTINITGINVTVNGATSTTRPNQTISPQGTYIFYVPNVCGTNAGAKYSFTSTVTYTEPGQTFAGPYFSSGAASGTVSSTNLPGAVLFMAANPSSLSPSGTTFVTFFNHSIPSNPFTVSFWFNEVSNASLAMDPSCVSDYLDFYSVPGDLGSALFDCHGVFWVQSPGPGFTDGYRFPNQTGTWWNVVLVDTGHYCSIYGNGVMYGNASCSPGSQSGNLSLFLGTTQPAVRPFSIYVANIQIYDGGLTFTQATRLAGEDVGGAPLPGAGIVSWWPLNGTAKDFVGTNTGKVLVSNPFTTNYP